MNDKKLAQPKRPDSKKKKSGVSRGGSRGGRINDVGRALRSAYDETLREDVPDDFLDLLGKLS